MKISEIFSLEPIDHGHQRGGERRADVSWHKNIEIGDKQYQLVNADGKVLKSGITKAEAERLRKKPEVIAKHGYLTIEQQ